AHTNSDDTLIRVNGKWLIKDMKASSVPELLEGRRRCRRACAYSPQRRPRWVLLSLADAQQGLGSLRLLPAPGKRPIRLDRRRPPGPLRCLHGFAGARGSSVHLQQQPTLTPRERLARASSSWAGDTRSKRGRHHP